MISVSAIFGNPHLLQELDENFEKIAPISLFVDHVKDPAELSRKIREFYFGDKQIDNTTREGVVDVSGNDPSLSVVVTVGFADVHRLLVPLRPRRRC